MQRRAVCVAGCPNRVSLILPDQQMPLVQRHAHTSDPSNLSAHGPTCLLSHLLGALRISLTLPTSRVDGCQRGSEQVLSRAVLCFLPRQGVAWCPSVSQGLLVQVLLWSLGTGRGECPGPPAWLAPACGVGLAQGGYKPAFSKGQSSPLKICSGDLFLSFLFFITSQKHVLVNSRLIRLNLTVFGGDCSLRAGRLFR